jgi:hypothetical protein
MELDFTTWLIAQHARPGYHHFRHIHLIAGCRCLIIDVDVLIRLDALKREIERQMIRGKSTYWILDKLN